MRIFLVQNSLYYPAHGGGDKSNRLLLEALAERGHECRVVARSSTHINPAAHAQLLKQLAARSVAVSSSDGGIVVFRHRGVEVRAVTSNPNLRTYLAQQIREAAPDVILASTDDPAQLLLEAELQSGVPVVYLARTTLALPFGPEGAFASELKTDRLKRTAGMVGVSRYVSEYIRRWGGIEAVALPISLLGPGPFPDLGTPENEYVTLVNPCAVKGISIFLALADAMPDVRFAAVPIWGTTEADLKALQRRPNIHILPPVDNIDELLAQTRVLLVPSLWAEARSRIVVEAMLRGVPVLAGNVGGIPEAMMGVDYLLPVRQIARYHGEVDDQMVPVADVPAQDIGPWQAALRVLLSDRARYGQLSRQARETALAYASSLSVAPFEDYLKRMAASPSRETAPSQGVLQPEDHLSRRFEQLSQEKRTLLALRLRKKGAPQHAGSARWFPFTDFSGSQSIRLFCFPYAGGGASAFLPWASRLPEAIALCPVRLPGREARMNEPPFREVAALVGSLAGAIHEFLDKPFAFFGHSMGCYISFELTRYLRRNRLPVPAALFVAAARAPQFRLGRRPPPDVSEEEFLEELRRREGTPPELLENDELRRLVLPALRADAELSRTYSYLPEPPLDCPIRAYGGFEDPNVRRDHLEPWAEQTTGSFVLRLLPGGHFFIHSSRELFLETLSRDLIEVLATVRLEQAR